MTRTLANGVVVDRSRVSHGETKRMIVLQMRLKKALANSDPDMFESALNEVETMTEKIIVSVPDDFYVPGTPSEVKAPAAGWLSHLLQERYEELTQMLQKPAGENEGE